MTYMSANTYVLLTRSCVSDAEDQVWVWRHETGDLFYDRNEWVRIRIEAEQWHDLAPVGPSTREPAKKEERSPYTITVSRDPFSLPLIWIMEVQSYKLARLALDIVRHAQS